MDAISDHGRILQQEMFVKHVYPHGAKLKIMIIQCDYTHIIQPIIHEVQYLPTSRVELSCDL